METAWQELIAAIIAQEKPCALEILKRQEMLRKWLPTEFLDYLGETYTCAWVGVSKLKLLNPGNGTSTSAPKVNLTAKVHGERGSKRTYQIMTGIYSVIIDRDGIEAMQYEGLYPLAHREVWLEQIRISPAANGSTIYGRTDKWKVKVPFGNKAEPKKRLEEYLRWYYPPLT